jgi:hypothetical protein
MHGQPMHGQQMHGSMPHGQSSLVYQPPDAMHHAAGQQTHNLAQGGMIAQSQPMVPHHSFGHDQMGHNANAGANFGAMPHTATAMPHDPFAIMHQPQVHSHQTHSQAAPQMGQHGQQGVGGHHGMGMPNHQQFQQPQQPQQPFSPW